MEKINYSLQLNLFNDFIWNGENLIKCHLLEVFRYAVSL